MQWRALPSSGDREVQCGAIARGWCGDGGADLGGSGDPAGVCRGVIFCGSSDLLTGSGAADQPQMNGINADEEDGDRDGMALT